MLIKSSKILVVMILSIICFLITLFVVEYNIGDYISRYELSNMIWLLFITIYIVLYMYIIYKSLRCKNKNMKSYRNVEYYTDLPDEYSLGDSLCIRNIMFGYVDRKLILSTILDLSNRKYINLESLKKVKKNKDGYEYYVSVDISKDLDILNDYERELLNFIFNKRADNKLDMTDFINNRIQLNERFEELGLDYNLCQVFWDSCAHKTYINSKKMYNKAPIYLWKIFSYTIVTLIIISVINIYVISPVTYKSNLVEAYVLMGIISFVILAFIIGAKASSLKDEYVDQYNKLLGLKKYLKKYSLIKSRYPIEVVLWEKYLVYASLFGMANIVSKEFKEELLNKSPKDESNNEYIYTMNSLRLDKIHPPLYAYNIVHSSEEKI